MSNLDTDNCEKQKRKEEKKKYQWVILINTIQKEKNWKYKKEKRQKHGNLEIYQLNHLLFLLYWIEYKKLFKKN